MNKEIRGRSLNFKSFCETRIVSGKLFSRSIYAFNSFENIKRITLNEGFSPPLCLINDDEGRREIDFLDLFE
jgi:hypothetical protein